MIKKLWNHRNTDKRSYGIIEIMIKKLWNHRNNDKKIMES